METLTLILVSGVIVLLAISIMLIHLYQQWRKTAEESAASSSMWAEKAGTTERQLEWFKKECSALQCGIQGKDEEINRNEKVVKHLQSYNEEAINPLKKALAYARGFTSGKLKKMGFALYTGDGVNEPSTATWTRIISPRITATFFEGDTSVIIENGSAAFQLNSMNSLKAYIKRYAKK